MKKKYIFLIVLLIVLIIEAIFYTIGASVDSTKLFGIDEKDYQIIEKTNNLSLIKSGGKYILKLKVEENQIDSLISDIENVGFYMVEEGAKTLTYDSVIEGLLNMNPDDVSKLYRCRKVVRRTFLSYLGQSREVYYWATFSENVDGIYEVCLFYMEI